MQSAAVGWELYERTHSAMALGFVGLVQVLPVILLTLPAGHVADTFERRRIVVLAQIAFAFSSLGLAIISKAAGPVYLMYLCLLLSGIARAFQSPARSAMLPQIVPAEAFANAATWNNGGFQAACAVGPALGGVLIAWQKGAALVYIIDAVTALVFLSFVAMITGLKTPRKDEGLTLKSLVAGFGFVWETKVILAAITLDMFAVLFGGATVLLPIYAKDILHAGPTGFGWLRAAPSIGAVAMAFVAACLPPFQKAGKTMLWAVAGFGVATVVFGLSRTFWLSFAMLMLTGGLDTISVIIRHTLVQLRTPDYLRGRVQAVNFVFIGTSNELGGFESGVVASLFGPVVSVVSGGIGSIIAVAAVAAAWPQIGLLGRLHDDAER